MRRDKARTTQLHHRTSRPAPEETLIAGHDSKPFNTGRHPTQQLQARMAKFFPLLFASSRLHFHVTRTTKPLPTPERRANLACCVPFVAQKKSPPSKQGRASMARLNGTKYDV
ncbi:hypothetical protein CGRA01v4_12812 [Colletotrichum graminicola]|nr:hypothetical protein CGRA01v4_12812 [Colletotrichum graminicola]